MEARALDAELKRDPEVSRRVVDFMLGDDTLTPPVPGLLRYVAWTAMARFLRPVVTAFDGWRDDEWGFAGIARRADPCPRWPNWSASTPAASVSSRAAAAARGGSSRGPAARFCETDSQRLASVTIESEPVLRIDHCESCGGYLKTYDGEGDEALLLSDWSSLHLDLIAHDRGMKKLAASLYEFEPRPTSPA